MSTIGSNIRNRRIELSMTQEELAKKLGYKSKSTINKIELGINDIPQSKIVQFADALDTTASFLMGWTEATPEEIKNSDTIADITDRLFKDSDYMEAVKLLNELDQKQIIRAKELLNLFFKEGFDEDK